jgi:hypothetical protein
MSFKKYYNKDSIVSGGKIHAIIPHEVKETEDEKLLIGLLLNKDSN